MNAPSIIEIPQHQITQASTFAILVVEDIHVNRRLIKSSLAQLGFQCDFAFNGKLGVTAARAKRYDLILMDYRMPEMDGVEATRLIRQHEADQGIRTPIIVHSSEDERSLRQTFEGVGADGYLAKPGRRGALQSILETYIQGLCLATNAALAAHS